MVALPKVGMLCGILANPQLVWALDSTEREECRVGGRGGIELFVYVAGLGFATMSLSLTLSERVELCP